MREVYCSVLTVVSKSDNMQYLPHRCQHFLPAQFSWLCFLKKEIFYKPPHPPNDRTPKAAEVNVWLIFKRISYSAPDVGTGVDGGSSGGSVMPRISKSVPNKTHIRRKWLFDWFISAYTHTHTQTYVWLDQDNNQDITGYVSMCLYVVCTFWAHMCLHVRMCVCLCVYCTFEEVCVPM